MRSLMVTAILFWLIFSANQALGQCEPKGLNCIDSLGRRQGYFIEQRVFFLNWEVGVTFYKHSIYLNDKRIGIQDYKTDDGFLLERIFFFDSTEEKLEVAIFYYNGARAQSGLFTYDSAVYDSAYIALDEKGRIIQTGRQGAYTGQWKYFNEEGKEVSKEEFALIREKYWYIKRLGWD